MTEWEGGETLDREGVELAAHHRRYLDLVGRFKSAWTFHQFLEGLQKIFVDADLGEYRPAEFRDVYRSLKKLSDGLDSASTEDFEAQLRLVEETQASLLASLAEQDSRLSPSLHRALFFRIDTYDQQILARLLRFYIYCWKTDLWTGDDACDKADLLMTRLAEDTTPGEAEPDWDRTRTLFEGVISSLVTPESVDAGLVETLCGLLDESRRACADADSIDEIREIVGSYRQLKHELGSHLFLPDIMMAVVHANWALRQAVQRVFQREERSIFADTERIFELEGRVEIDGDLDERLTEMRSAIASFEQRVQDRNVRLEEVTTLRQSIEELIPRLSVDTAETAAHGAAPSAEAAEVAGVPPVDAKEPSHQLERDNGTDGEAELLRPAYRELVRALESEGRGPGSVHEACRGLRLAAFELEAREVLAYRRLVGETASDMRLERLVLVAAALRYRIRRETEGLQARLAGGGSVTASMAARLATRVAGDYEHRLRNAVEHSVLEGDQGEAQSLQLVLMRLQRDASELWLLVHRPVGDLAVHSLE